MQNIVTQLSLNARKSVPKRDWHTVLACADQILNLDNGNPEGHFLKGLVEKADNKPRKAISAFENALIFDSNRYDAAIELANQYVISNRFLEAIELQQKYVSYLNNSPLYLDMAATTYATIGLAEQAWPLYEKANRLQPNVDIFQANLASCAVYLGRLEEAKSIYEKLLERFPNHQRNHYQLSRLEKATDDSHIQQMKRLLFEANLPHEKKIFIYFALGKELEDLNRWDEAFGYYKLGGDAVKYASKYQVTEDTGIIDKVMDICSNEWLQNADKKETSKNNSPTPIFIFGLPRTGSTLTERILSSHSLIESVGETQFFEHIMRRESGVESRDKMNTKILTGLKKDNLDAISSGYMELVSYMLNDCSYFIEKLPYNFLYAGFIAKSMPKARLIYINRHPMDACFAMYKQVFTWAYKYSYTLEDLGSYYIAHRKLLRHWQEVLGERLIIVDYEKLVSDQENQTRKLIDELGIEFEDACLSFQTNKTASMTASSVQVRDGIHSRSVGNWKNFRKQLAPLVQTLNASGISTS